MAVIKKGLLKGAIGVLVLVIPFFIGNYFSQSLEKANYKYVASLVYILSIVITVLWGLVLSKLKFFQKGTNKHSSSKNKINNKDDTP